MWQEIVNNHTEKLTSNKDSNKNFRSLYDQISVDSVAVTHFN